MPLRRHQDASVGLPLELDGDAPVGAFRRVSRTGWIARRLALGVITLFFVSLLIFVATQALPGDAATQILGRDATPERLAAVREQLNLNEPAVTQYLDWIGGVWRGDLGTSIGAQVPVTQLLGQRLVNSLVLIVLAVAIIFPLSFVIGVLSAARRDTRADHAVSAVSLVLVALPEFVVGFLLVALFSTSVFHILPAVSSVDSGSALDDWKSLVLPVAVLVIVVTPYLVRLVRASVIDVLESEYVRMARMKGVSESRVLLVHALPNALVPAIQVSALVIGWLAGGVVVVEYLFGYSGLGTGLMDAVATRDVPVIQAVTLLMAAAYVFTNVFADMLTIVVTPRLRTAQWSGR
jgi:peptide/nickel transport system permease protein